MSRYDENVTQEDLERAEVAMVNVAASWIPIADALIPAQEAIEDLVPMLVAVGEPIDP